MITIFKFPNGADDDITAQFFETGKNRSTKGHYVKEESEKM